MLHLQFIYGIRCFWITVFRDINISLMSNSPVVQNKHTRTCSNCCVYNISTTNITSLKHIKLLLEQLENQEQQNSDSYTNERQDFPSCDLFSTHVYLRSAYVAAGEILRQRLAILFAFTSLTVTREEKQDWMGQVILIALKCTARSLMK